MRNCFTETVLAKYVVKCECEQGALGLCLVIGFCEHDGDIWVL
jgi:hypothetical protein